MSLFTRNDTRPWGLKWRSSYWFVTLVVGLGLMSDMVVYSVIIPVIPFQLQKLGYSGVSGLVGWLLFSFSAGLVISTPPIASLSERWKNRQIPLLVGLVALIGSQVMIMEAPSYWLMCLARVFQGISSSVVWVVGLALLCDSTPESLIGRQLGIAMTGFSLGLLLGPPVAGVLYERWGFRAPFIFGIIFTASDLLGRILLIERKDAILWGLDPAAESFNVESVETGGNQETLAAVDINRTSSKEQVTAALPTEATRSPRVDLTPFGVLVKLFGSSRAMICVINTLIYGVAYSGQEAILTLHLQAIWGLTSSQAGLAFIAAIVPTFVAMPLAGWWTDKKGTEWVTFFYLILALPWWIVVIINGSLPQFLVFFGIQSFFTSGVVSLLTAELAAVCRSIDNLGYAHVYGAWNFAYGIGSGVGPIISGQIYDHSSQGWLVFCSLSAGLLFFSMILAFFYTGESPLISRLMARVRRTTENA